MTKKIPLKVTGNSTKKTSKSPPKASKPPTSPCKANKRSKSGTSDGLVNPVRPGYRVKLTAKEKKAIKQGVSELITPPKKSKSAKVEGPTILSQLMEEIHGAGTPDKSRGNRQKGQPPAEIDSNMPPSGSLGSGMNGDARTSDAYLSPGSSGPDYGSGRGGYRPKKYDTAEEKAQAQRDHANRWIRNKSKSSRDIGDIPFGTIDWDRRNRCKTDLKLFCEEYMKAVFFKQWSDDQLKCVTKAQTVIIKGGKFALAMPRGGGKTAICRGAVLFATAYGYKRYPFNIGSTDSKSCQTLEFIKTYWYRSPELQQDFPEIGYPILKLENRWHLARGQEYMGEATHVTWGSDRIRYPCITLPKEIADWYRTMDPKSVMTLRDGREIPASGGVILACAGIDGSIRGDADVHPVTLEQPRPDLVLLDDVQKDQKADSPLLCEKLIRLIDGAVTGLAGPDGHIDVLMPCTVIREDDVADTFIDPLRRPDYRGERCQMVKSWPPGVTDYEITFDKPASKLWNEYSELRRKSLQTLGDESLNTEFYIKHRKVMDENFVCSWPERFDSRVEVSAQQSAMNLRLSIGSMFLPEYQNIGRKLNLESDILITAKQLAERVTSFPQRILPPEIQHLGAFLDVQNEVFFYCVLAVDSDFTGSVVDYGTWPEVQASHFTKDQIESWSLVTNEFFKAYPQYRNKAVRNNQGKVRAPLEAKIYFGLQKVVNMLMGRKYVREGEHQRIFNIQRLGIDTRWGQGSDTIKRFIRESGIKEIIPYQGAAMPPTNRQFEEYVKEKTFQFEDQLHPNVREPKWCIRPNPDGMYYMMADVNRLKDFAFARLASPPGSPGNITLFNAPAERHALFAGHICNSEYPEPVTARGITKNMWKEREGVAWNNDWLDCFAGCCAMVSHLGASYKTTADKPKIIRRKLSSVYSQKRA
jgi:hypothetical protein